MDVSAEKTNADEGRGSDPFLAAAEIFKEICKWFAGFFTITEEERSKAGIIFIDEMRDK